MSVQTFTNWLLVAASSLGEAPPDSQEKAVQQKRLNERIHTDKVRSAGQAGRRLELLLQQFFSSLDWKQVMK